MKEKSTHRTTDNWRKAGKTFEGETFEMNSEGKRAG